MGKFKCFLCCKGQKYRIDMEVMSQDHTPNVLQRETTFLMGILKLYFMAKKKLFSPTRNYGNMSSQYFSDKGETQDKPVLVKASEKTKGNST